MLGDVVHRHLSFIITSNSVICAYSFVLFCTGCCDTTAELFGKRYRNRRIPFLTGLPTTKKSVFIKLEVTIDKFTLEDGEK